MGLVKVISKASLTVLKTSKRRKLPFLPSKRVYNVTLLESKGTRCTASDPLTAMSTPLTVFLKSVHPVDKVLNSIVDQSNVLRFLSSVELG